MWSDPDEIEGWGLNQRGAGWVFGKNPTNEFCHNNNLQLIARAHQLAMDGYQYHHDDTKLVTVWSAPNYMYRSGNKASIMEVSSERTINFKIFNAVPEKDRLPTPDRIPSYFA